jgi:hypothetical protein
MYQDQSFFLAPLGGQTHAYLAAPPPPLCNNSLYLFPTSDQRYFIEGGGGTKARKRGGEGKKNLFVAADNLITWPPPNVLHAQCELLIRQMYPANSR